MIEQNNIKLSIIIPIYNGEKTINKCLDSIINQNLNDIEIILVNDGSNDNTEKICNEYKKKYNYIKLINQKNSGVSAARNKGLEKSVGKYITFVDSDDFISNYYHKNMIHHMEEKESDIIISGMNKVIIDLNGNISKDKHVVNPMDLNKEEFCKLFFELNKNNMLMGPCNKLYKSEIAKKIRFDEERISAEDYIYNLNYYIYCNKVSIVEEYGYNYVKNNNSITNTLDNKYSEIYEINNSLEYRELTTNLYLQNGISKDKINEYYKSRDYIWFYYMVMNILNYGSPYNIKAAINKIENIMLFEDARQNILTHKPITKLEILVKILYKVNSPQIVYFIFSIIKKQNNKK